MAAAEFKLPHGYAGLVNEALARLNDDFKRLLEQACIASPMVARRRTDGDWRGLLRAVRGLAVRTTDEQLQVRYCALLQALQDVTTISLFMLR